MEHTTDALIIQARKFFLAFNLKEVKAALALAETNLPSLTVEAREAMLANIVALRERREFLTAQKRNQKGAR